MDNFDVAVVAIFNNLSSVSASYGLSIESGRDEELIKADIFGKLKGGWSEIEVFFYLKNMEEVSGTNIPEDVALANMERIKKAVEERLLKK